LILRSLADRRRLAAWQTECMRTVVLGESREIRELIEQRKRTGADLYDEVWKGEYHMAPAPHRSHGLLESDGSALLSITTAELTAQLDWPPVS
jgi:hypothetical protein